MGTGQLPLTKGLTPGDVWISFRQWACCYMVLSFKLHMQGLESIDPVVVGSLFTALRLLIHTILCLFPDSLCLMGPCCSSWGIPARYTTMRSFINAFGAVHLPFVAEANQTISLNLNGKMSTSVFACFH